MFVLLFCLAVKEMKRCVCLSGVEEGKTFDDDVESSIKGRKREGKENVFSG